MKEIIGKNNVHLNKSNGTSSSSSSFTAVATPTVTATAVVDSNVTTATVAVDDVINTSYNTKDTVIDVTTTTPVQLTPVRVAPAIPSTTRSTTQNETLPQFTSTIGSRFKRLPSFQTSGKSYTSHNYPLTNNQNTDSHQVTSNYSKVNSGESGSIRPSASPVGKSITQTGNFGGGRRLSQQAERAVVSFIRSSQSEVASHNTNLVRSNSFTLQDLDRARKSIQASLEADDFDINSGLVDDATYRYFHSLSPSSAIRSRRFSKSLPELYHNNVKGFPLGSSGMRDDYNYFGPTYLENGDDDEDDDDACSSSTQDIPDSSAWRGKSEFYFTGISLALGLNTLVRFPYFAYKFHTGSFLMAFTLCTFFISLPILTIEYALGQLTRRGPISAFGSLCPLLRGVPVAAAVVSLFSSFLYSSINSWYLFYFFKSFHSAAPWSLPLCLNSSNPIACKPFNKTELIASIATNSNGHDDDIHNIINSTIPLLPTPVSYNKSNINLVGHSSVTSLFVDTNSFDYSKSSEENLHEITYDSNEDGATKLSDFDVTNITQHVYHPELTFAQEFFDFKVLELNLNVGLLDSIQWQLIIFVLISWIVVFISLRKKILFSSRPSSCLSLVPFGIIFILFIRAISLPGAREGIFYLFKPKLNHLLNPSLWSHAASLSLHALGCIVGIAFAKASCNRERNNFLIDAFFITIINLIAVLLVGIIIFATLGHLARKRGVNIASVLVNGMFITIYYLLLNLLIISFLFIDAGVAFVAFSELLSSSQVTSTSIWSVIIFFTFFSLGLDYQISFVRSFLVAIEDAYGSSVKRNFLAHQIFALILCLLAFLSTLIFLTPQGLLLFQLFDQYIIVFLTLVLAFFETILMSWFYGELRTFFVLRYTYLYFYFYLGGSNLAQVIRLKIGKRLGCYLPCCWNVITPIALLSILIWNCVMFKEPTFRNDSIQYPLTMQASIVALVIILLMIIPLIGCHQVNRSSRGSFFSRLMAACKPVQREMPNIPLVNEYDDTLGPSNTNQSLPMSQIPTVKYSTTDNGDASVPLSRNHGTINQTIGNSSIINSFKDALVKEQSRTNYIRGDNSRIHPIDAVMAQSLYSQNTQEIQKNAVSTKQIKDDSIVISTITSEISSPQTTANVNGGKDENNGFTSLPISTINKIVPTINGTTTTNGFSGTINTKSTELDDSSSNIIHVPVTFALLKQLDRETDL